jgi:hypothetical protein
MTRVIIFDASVSPCARELSWRRASGRCGDGRRRVQAAVMFEPSST